MIRVLVAGVAVAAVLSGCAPASKKRPTPAYMSAPTYAEGFADGQRMERQRLADSPAFHVTRAAMLPCRNAVSWMPPAGEGTLDVDTFWAARAANIKLITRCHERDAAKRRAIIRMLDEVRRSD